MPSRDRRVSAPGLILASASPRRAELLAAAGFPFVVHVASVDETLRPGEAADVYVRRLAEAKARAVAASVPGQWVLGADTVVVVDGRVFGKPRDGAEARAMLGRLSGRIHQVLTGVCLVMAGSATGGVGVPGADGEGPHVDMAQTAVEFAPLSPAEVDWYVASGEPMDKAGAYAIQGLASRFIRRIDGSYSNVVGLPIELVSRMCTAAGILLS